MARTPREDDSRNYTPEQAADLELPPSGGAQAFRDMAAKGLNAQEIERVADMSTFASKAESLAFYEEKIEIVIADSNDINPEPYVFLSVNGRGPMPLNSPWVPRNVPIKMARKFVEVLARSKPVSLRTVEARDYTGGLTTKVQRYSAGRYPFSVIHDPNPMGRAWLQEIMRQR